MKLLGKIIAAALWVLTGLGAVAGGANYFLTHSMVAAADKSVSAPQEAALAATSLLFAIIPYVLARSWEKVTDLFSEE